MSVVHDRVRRVVRNVIVRNPPPKPTSDGARVLLVMERALGNLVHLTLRHGRYTTQHTTDLTDGRRILREWQPHLAILDIDHYERFMDVFRGGSEQAQVPILAFTRQRNTYVKLAALERGVDDIFQVPFTLDEILARPFPPLPPAPRSTV